MKHRVFGNTGSNGTAVGLSRLTKASSIAAPGVGARWAFIAFGSTSRRRVIAIGAFAAALASIASGAGRKDDAVAVAEQFLRAVNSGDCMTAWSHYSSATQKNIRDEMRRALREADGPITHTTPETRYCQGSYDRFKRGSARLVSSQGDSAVVSVTFSEGTHLALVPFLSTPYREYAGELKLSREKGAWKVERSPAPIGRQGWNLVEVGDVDVAYSLHGDPNRRLVEATAVLRAPRVALQAVLADSSTWPQLLPGFSRLERLDAPSNDRQRLRLHFGEWQQPVVVEARSYGNLVDARLPWTTLQWTTAGEPQSPVLMSGSWKLRPRFEGTWVTLTLVIEPRQWPADLAERLLASDRVAAAVLELDAKARVQTRAPSQ